MDRIEKEGLTVAELRPYVMTVETGVLDAIVNRAAAAIDRDASAQVPPGLDSRVEVRAGRR